MKLSDIPLELIQIPRSWKYHEKWFENNVASKFDLNSICEDSNAGEEIEYVICRLGKELHSNIKLLNSKIKQIKLGFYDSYDSSGLGLLPHELQSTTYDMEWERAHMTVSSTLEVVNADLAPKFVQSIFAEIYSFIDTGRKTFIECVKYIEDCEADLNNKRLYERKLSGQHELLNSAPIKKQDSLLIEKTHLKATNGFIYIMKHPLLREDVVKLGFTSRNPDVRAQELSKKSGLPDTFIVKKYWRTDDPYIFEQRIHKKLMQYSVGGEFYKCSLDEIIQEVEHALSSN